MKLDAYTTVEYKQGLAYITQEIPGYPDHTQRIILNEKQAKQLLEGWE